MRAKSVLHLCPSAAWGGAEQMADTLRAECERAGWDTRFELPFEVGDRWSPAAAADHPVSWWRWALRARAPADVVHAHLPWPDRLVAAAIAARGRPLVVTFQLLPEEGRWPRDRCLHLPSERVLRAAGALRGSVRWVALSRADARRLEARIGAPVSIVRNAPPAPPSAVNPLSWPEGRARLLSIGRLCPQKGFDRVIRALSTPELRALSWHWNIIGDGADRSSLRALLDASGLADRVTLCGARPAIDGLSGADLLLAPSRFEGMPLVPLECAEASVPVLASTIDPHAELYESAPESLLPLDEGAWPSMIAAHLTDASKRESLRVTQRRVLGDSPRRAMFAAYQRLYHQLTP